MKTIYRLKRMVSLDSSTAHTVFVDVFRDEWQMLQYVDANPGVYVVEKILDSR